MIMNQFVPELLIKIPLKILIVDKNNDAVIFLSAVSAFFRFFNCVEF